MRALKAAREWHVHGGQRRCTQKCDNCALRVQRGAHCAMAAGRLVLVFVRLPLAAGHFVVATLRCIFCCRRTPRALA